MDFIPEKCADEPLVNIGGGIASDDVDGRYGMLLRTLRRSHTADATVAHLNS